MKDEYVIGEYVRPDDPEFPPVDEETCPARHDGFYCCRVMGHKGVHVALVTGDEIVAVWE